MSKPILAAVLSCAGTELTDEEKARVEETGDEYEYTQ